MPIKWFQARVGLELMGRMAECYSGRRREVVQAGQKERTRELQGPGSLVGLVLVQMPENLCGVGGRYIKDHKMLLEGDAFRSDLAQCTATFSNIYGHLPIPRDDDSVGIRPRYLPMEAPWLILLHVVCRAIFEIQHCPCISTWVQIQHSASLTVLAGWMSGAGQ